MAAKVRQLGGYEALPEGLRALAALVLLRDRIIKPLLAAQCDPRRRPKLKNPRPIDLRYDTVQRHMRDLLEELGMAA